MNPTNESKGIISFAIISLICIFTIIIFSALGTLSPETEQITTKFIQGINNFFSLVVVIFSIIGMIGFVLGLIYVFKFILEKFNSPAYL